MINQKKKISIEDIVELYFSDTSTVDYMEIKKMKRDYGQQLENYADLNPPSWISERARSLSNITFDFINKNKNSLYNKKKNFSFQEYLNISNFKIALKNLGLLKYHIDTVKKSYSKALFDFFFKIGGIIGLLGISIWGAYEESDFCFLINIILFFVIILSILHMSDKKKSKGD
jgi:hypothetical protein